MEEIAVFVAKLFGVLVLTGITQGVAAGFDLWDPTVVNSLVVAVIWLVIVFGGFLFIDDLGDIF